jgi:orotidine-5'-phosphate decarboxylase
MAALGEVMGHARRQGLLVILDAKRGDIGSTAERHAVALFDTLGADALTASPYLGRDALAPLLERAEGYVYVLCRTSNEGAAEVQSLAVDGQPLYLAIARGVERWADGRPVAGLVVGATAPAELARIRRAVPALGFLVPGIGAQGGDVAAVLADGPATAPPAGEGRGGGLLVNVSRGIAGAALAAPDGRSPADPGAAIAAAAADWASRLRC